MIIENEKEILKKLKFSKMRTCESKYMHQHYAKLNMNPIYSSEVKAFIILYSDTQTSKYI